MLRLLVLIVLMSALLVPSVTTANSVARRATNNQACRRMTKQIAHYEGTVLRMAEQRGNDLWANATQAQINRLMDRRADICPEWSKQRSAYGRAKIQAEQMKKLMITAGKMALKYFTGGWF